jgi:hypothetical protein
MKLYDPGPYHFTQNGVLTIEQKYGARYMGHWCTKRPSGGWNEQPVDVFYVENPDTSKGHSNYFGMFVRDDQAYITDALSCFSEPMSGILENDLVYVSRYRHDMVVTPLGNHIDGGRDYLKISLLPVPAADSAEPADSKLNRPPRFVTVTVKDGEFEFSESLNKQSERKIQ